MPIVRLDFRYDTSSIFKQTPLGNGKWGDFTFTTKPIKNPDILVVGNYPSREIDIKIPKGGSYLLSQEPPIDLYKWTTKYFNFFDYVFTSWDKSLSDNIVPYQGLLPWHVKKSYDELSILTPESLNKQNKVSWITSNLRNTSGHRRRLKFLHALQKNNFEFELFGRGFKPIDDKFDGLSPYKYNIALENYSCNDYWTEKIADCFLSWSMPIYWGCKNIDKYFPAEAIIQVNPKKPKEAIEKINRAIADNAWEKNLDAIKEARDKVLNQYQLFPNIVQHFTQHSVEKGPAIPLYIPKAMVPKQSIFNKFAGYLIRKF